MLIHTRHTQPFDLSWEEYVRKSYTNLDNGSIKKAYSSIIAPIISRPLRILDVGTGPGQYLAAIAEEEPTSQLYGIDINLQFLKRANLELSNRNYRATMISSDGTCLPFVDNSFDFVMAHLSLPYAKNDRLFLKECNRVLKKGGGFWLSTHGYGFYLSRLIKDTFLRKPRWLASLVCGFSSEYFGWKPLRDAPLSVVFLTNQLNNYGMNIKFITTNKFMNASRIITAFAIK